MKDVSDFMNEVVISGKLLSHYSVSSTSYEGVLEYKTSEVRSGNIITHSAKLVGVYIPKSMMELSIFTELLGKDIIIGGRLTSTELDKSVRTSVIVVLDLQLNKSNEFINKVEVSGQVTNIASTKKGINYGVRNLSDLVTTRIFSRDAVGISLGQYYKVVGQLTSYQYVNKKTNNSYNVNGVFELTREVIDFSK